MNWKITAIIFIVLFFSLLIFNVWSIYVYEKDLGKINDCYYNVCGEYPDAYYEDKICYCYDYDILGYLVVAKTKIIK